MTTPAGWYDDGSGRQRWWDGQQWTEHFAPEAAAPVEPAAPAAPEIPAEEPAVHEEPSIDDTVIRPSAETEITPDAQDWSAPAATPVDPYAAPEAPTYPAVSQEQPVEAFPAAAPAYPGTAPTYPGAYANTPGGYPAAAPYGQPVPEGPKKPSVLGLVGLGLGVLGTILVFIPVIGFLGFILLAAAFVVSLISLFLKGKKWPGIAGLILSVVGVIIGIVMSFVYLFAFAQGMSNEIDNRPSSSPSIESTDPGETDGGTTGTGRPTAAEVAVGIAAIVESTGAEGYTQENINCFADEFVASDIDDETLRIIASGDDATFSDADAALAFTDAFTDALPVCLVG